MQLSRSLLAAEGEKGFSTHTFTPSTWQIPRNPFQGVLVASRKAFLGSLPCLQLPLTAEPTHCQPTGSQTPPHVPFPYSSSHVGGLDPPQARFCAFPFSSVTFKPALKLLLITVPLSPLRGLPPQPGAALCGPSLPFPCAEHGWRLLGH